MGSPLFELERRIVMALLLDTCAVIWVTQDEDMNAESRAAINAETDAGRDIFISAITAWEFGLMEKSGRMVSTGDMLSKLEAVNGFKFLDVSPRLFHDSCLLPGDLHNDPADRILIATAREYGFQLVTRDAAILDYGKAGYVRCLAC